ncbi:hypothetical protein NDU88_002163 [Pleurodeles waltl]|uniref:Uncharacterized protein n=1 Tax=Pleurodeles waltl TaxID=8319 RepID=A0AAV7KRE2_PLEWA|nr:hypothetical protein NDU88_002163 [Pleurodeles waltl]
MYLPKIHVAFVDLRAILQEEKFFFKDWSIFLESLYEGTPGKEAGAVREEHEACTTKLSGVGCLDKKPGSAGATRYLRATVLFTAVDVTGFFQIYIIGSRRASLKGKRGSAIAEAGCSTSIKMLGFASDTGRGRPRKSAAFLKTEWKEAASSVYSPGDVKSHSGEVSKPLAVSKP